MIGWPGLKPSLRFHSRGLTFARPRSRAWRSGRTQRASRSASCRRASSARSRSGTGTGRLFLGTPLHFAAWAPAGSASAVDSMATATTSATRRSIRMVPLPGRRQWRDLSAPSRASPRPYRVSQSDSSKRPGASIPKGEPLRRRARQLRAPRPDAPRSPRSRRSSRSRVRTIGVRPGRGRRHAADPRLGLLRGLRDRGGVVALRVVRVREQRGPWILLGAGIALYAAGNLLWAFWLQHLEAPPIPSVCDVLWLSLYPCSYAGLVWLARRDRRLPAGVWLDGIIAGLGIAALGAATRLRAGATPRPSAARRRSPRTWPIRWATCCSPRSWWAFSRCAAGGSTAAGHSSASASWCCASGTASTCSR